ncbi:MAG: hypothetical protein MUQ27_12725 [Acidimicrobiia bacterium]|nr:hypothetical protein [Acidimicrobiia bacterium]
MRVKDPDNRTHTDAEPTEDTIEAAIVECCRPVTRRSGGKPNVIFSMRPPTRSMLKGTW